MVQEQEEVVQIEGETALSALVRTDPVFMWWILKGLLWFLVTEPIEFYRSIKSGERWHY